MALTHNTAVRNGLADYVVDQLDGGTVQIRTGAGSGASSAATGTLLATLTAGTPAFGAAANGTATANAIATVQAVASGTPGHFRALTSGGTVVYEGSAGATGSGADMEVNDGTGGAGIVLGGDVAVTSWTYTAPV